MLKLDRSIIYPQTFTFVRFTYTYPSPSTQFFMLNLLPICKYFNPAENTATYFLASWIPTETFAARKSIEACCKIRSGERQLEPPVASRGGHRLRNSTNVFQIFDSDRALSGNRLKFPMVTVSDATKLAKSRSARELFTRKAGVLDRAIKMANFALRIGYGCPKFSKII